MSEPNFGNVADRWFAEARLANSTAYQRQLVYARDIEPFLRTCQLIDIDTSRVRVLCADIKARRGTATALHVRDIINNVFSYARLHGFNCTNPVAQISCRSVGQCKPREKWLSPEEVGFFVRRLAESSLRTEYLLALKLLLLTLTRRSELVQAKWTEIDFENAVWIVPPGRTKSAMPRHVYLSRQSFDILIELKVRAGSSEWLLPSAIHPDVPVAPTMLNKTVASIFEGASDRGLSLGRLTPYDLYRTGLRNLQNAGFSSRWIDLALGRDAVERAARLDRTMYADQLRHMLQEWSNMIDAWVNRLTYSPALSPISS